MPRKSLKKILPDPSKLKDNILLRPFKRLLENRQLWTTKRRNVIWGFAVGVFCGFMPTLGHSALAVIIAIGLRANVAVAFASTFITNPITIVPIFYGSYKLGCYLLGVEYIPPSDEIGIWESIKILLDHSWQPLLIGCFTAGAIVSLISSTILNQLWKWNVTSNRRKMTALRQEKNNQE